MTTCLHACHKCADTHPHVHATSPELFHRQQAVKFYKIDRQIELAELLVTLKSLNLRDVVDGLHEFRVSYCRVLALRSSQKYAVCGARVWWRVCVRVCVFSAFLESRPHVLLNEFFRV